MDGTERLNSIEPKQENSNTRVSFRVYRLLVLDTVKPQV